MTLTGFLAYSAALGIAAAIPGPGITALVARALGSGFRSSLAMSFGLMLGDLTYLTAVVLGLAFVAQTFGMVFLAIKWLGVAYLAFLGWRFWNSGRRRWLDDTRLGLNGTRCQFSDTGCRLDGRRRRFRGAWFRFNVRQLRLTGRGYSFRGFRIRRVFIADPGGLHQPGRAGDRRQGYLGPSIQRRGRGASCPRLGSSRASTLLRGGS